MTRSPYAAFVYSSFDLNRMVKQSGIHCKDVPTDLWAVEAIQKAYRAKFFSGFPDNTFRANENITRLQAIVSLVNGLRLTIQGTDALQVLQDREEIPEWAQNAVAAAIAHQLLVNYPERSRLNPNEDATRAEVAAMLYQQRVDVGVNPQISSPYIVVA